MDSNTIYYFVCQTCNLDFQPAYNRYNSQSNFYDVPILEHTSLFPEHCILLSPENTQSTHSQHIIYLFPSGYGPFVIVLGEFIFLCICCQHDPIVTITHAKKIQISKMSVQESPSETSSLEDDILTSIESLCDKMDAFHSRLFLEKNQYTGEY